jgi:hypothetical protein
MESQQGSAFGETTGRVGTSFYISPGGQSLAGTHCRPPRYIRAKPAQIIFRSWRS